MLSLLDKWRKWGSGRSRWTPLDIQNIANSPLGLCPTPMYSSFRHSMLLPEGLEGVDNTKPSEVGWLREKILAIWGQDWWEGRKGWISSAKIWVDYFKVYNHLKIKYLRVKLYGSRKSLLPFHPVCENCIQLVYLLPWRKLTSQFCAYLSNHLNNV